MSGWAKAGHVLHGVCHASLPGLPCTLRCTALLPATMPHMPRVCCGSTQLICMPGAALPDYECSSCLPAVGAGAGGTPPPFATSGSSRSGPAACTTQ